MGPARGASSPVSTGAQRVSLKDIADELGISQTAVSFAINDRPGVSEQTRRRVKQVAAELGWTPVYAAQALGSSRTMTIGFAPARSVQGLTDETFMLHFMAGVHTSLSPKGYGLLYRPCRSLNEEMSVYRGWASSKRVDGVILVDLRADDPRPALLRELGVRAVLAGGPDPNDYVPSLSIDDSRTMGTVLEHLSSLGHRRIAYLSGDANLDYSQGRVAAFRSFARRRGLESIAIEFTNFAAERAVTLTMGMLRSPQPPTAFIYETEILAAASLHAMAKAYATCAATIGRSASGEGRFAAYPSGLPAIVSFEDSFICETAYPSITSVHRDAGEYGVKVARLLLKVLAGEQVGGNRRILTPKLVVRDSTSEPVDPS